MGALPPVVPDRETSEVGKMLDDYRRARKLGHKQLQTDVSAGRYPYLPALDDILKGEGYQGEVPMGTMEIDIDLIAGTRTRGRQNTFATNFMPLPESGSEFSMKWSDLIDSQRAEGIRDPIVVYEFMQRFYVQEGNKRVSVLRYLGQPTILASVTRVVPMPSDTEAYRIYQEFMRKNNAEVVADNLDRNGLNDSRFEGYEYTEEIVINGVSYTSHIKGNVHEGLILYRYYKAIYDEGEDGIKLVLNPGYLGLHRRVHADHDRRLWRVVARSVRDRDHDSSAGRRPALPSRL